MRNMMRGVEMRRSSMANLTLPVLAAVGRVRDGLDEGAGADQLL
jgi:hypothetical protein